MDESSHWRSKVNLLAELDGRKPCIGGLNGYISRA